MPQPFPEATNANLDAALLDEPGLEFGERCVGLARHLGAEGIVTRGELRLGAARPRPRARLSRPLPPPEKFVDTLTRDAAA